jgi:ATP-dependent Lon protease
VRDKALAAMRAGIFTVILPRKNLLDLRKAPKELKRRMTFLPVDNMAQVLEAALAWEPGRRAEARPRASSSPAAAPVAAAKSSD